MTTPIIVRKVSNVTGANNNTLSDSTTSNSASSPVRPSRVVRVLSAKTVSSNINATTNGTTDNNNNNNASSTSTVDQQQQQPPQTSQSIESNNNNTNTPDVASSNGTTVGKKIIVRRVVKRPVGGEATAGTTSSNNDNNNTNTNTAPDENNSTINNNNISSNNVVQPSANNNITNEKPSTTATTEIASTNEVNNNNNTTSTTSTPTTNPTTPRTNIADRWLNRNTTSTTTTTPTTTTTNEAQTVPKRRVRSINKPEDKPSDSSTVATSTTTPTPVTTTATTTPENKNINSTNAEFGTRLVTAAKSHSTISNTGTTATPVSPHQTSKSMNDIPEPKTVKALSNKLGSNLKLLTPEQLMMDKKMDRGSDNIRPLRPLEIATWYGGSVSVATEDPMFDNSSIDDLKKEGPDIYYTNFLFNPLFDEQSACDTPTINTTAQEVLQYNFVVELMKKKNPNTSPLIWDPIAFEEEMRNASTLSSLTLKNISSGHTHTDSVTSTEDVLSREDIGYPINKCSKNWKYQLKKKRENTKTSFNPTDGMFTPRASIQLQSSSPSSPATSNSAVVNPLFDHLYYMPCWKHQIQLDQIVKRGGEQKKVQ